MARLRRLLESAVTKLDEIGERSHAADVAKLTPAQRERYEHWEARGAAARAGVPEHEMEDARLVGVVLQGAAGEVVHGVRKAPRGPEPLEDPDAWTERMRAERTARDEVRAAYLAPERHPVRIIRVATRGASQVREVAEHLATSGLAARPDLVYGAARVPDLIDPGRMGKERGGLVEWDVVHAAVDPLPPCAPAAVTTLDARDLWVARRPGDPAPLDEDLALDVLARAGVGPQATIAVARDTVIDKISGAGEEGTSSILAQVRGVHLLVPPGATDEAVRAACETPRPWDLPAGPPEGLVVDVLQWDALAQAVHPVRQHRPIVPSPFPHLPLTPQELLRSYLEIVGIDPADTYAAQVTHDRQFDLMSRTSTRWGVRRTGGGPKLPCADGKERRRMAGGHHIVVAYRDHPRYVEGRARFDVYAERELQAHLRRNLGLRPPVPRPPNRLERTLERVGDVYEFFAMEPGYVDDFVAPRYCWPPVGR